MRLQPRSTTTNKKRAACRAVTVLAALGLFLWFVLFRFVSLPALFSSSPSSSSSAAVDAAAAAASRQAEVARIAKQIVAQHQQQQQHQQQEEDGEEEEAGMLFTRIEYFGDAECSPRLLLSAQVFSYPDKAVVLPNQPPLQHVLPFSKDQEVRSIRLVSKLGYADLRSAGGKYQSSVLPLDGCVRVFASSRPGEVVLYSATPLLQQRQISLSTLDSLRFDLLRGKEPTAPVAKFRVVFSSESAEYFGYQVYANRLAFAQSQRRVDATWTRLLTCEEPDDLARMNRFPTFTAPRHPYSLRYVPINKPDVITKWFASQDAPQEEVILVIDPDSWLLGPVYDRFIARVKPGHALGQQTYYTGSRTAQRLWRELCEFNCERDMDLVGVPYVVHRDDLAAIAPLWKHYVLKIKHRMEDNDKTAGGKRFSDEYSSLDVAWAAEMFGYNMAAAHLNIKHEIETDLQVRDVDGERTEEECKDKVSLHMGRAWFPTGHAMAKPYLHTEGKSLRMYGDQVWCKCNYTASTVKPWPIPRDGVDFVSKHTLRLLHESEKEYGPVPHNPKYRRNANLKEDYGWTKK